MTEEEVRRSGSFDAPVFGVVSPGSVVFFLAGLELWEGIVGKRFFDDGHFGEGAIRVLDAVGKKVDVEESIAIIVGEGGRVTAIDDVDAGFLGALAEGDSFSIWTLTRVEEKLVGDHVVADVDVETAVAIDVCGGGSGGPGASAIKLCASGGSGVLELEVTFLKVEKIGAGAAGEEDVWLAISIEIADCDASTGHARVVEVAHGMVDIHAIDVGQPGVVGGDELKEVFGVGLAGRGGERLAADVCLEGGRR